MEKDICDEYINKKFYIRKDKKVVGLKLTSYIITFNSGGDTGTIKFDYILADDPKKEIHSDYYRSHCSDNIHIYKSIEDAIDDVSGEVNLGLIKFKDIFPLLDFTPENVATGPAHCRRHYWAGWGWNGYKPVKCELPKIQFDVLNKKVTIPTGDYKKYYSTEADCLLDNQVEIIDFEDTV